ncbi:MAG: hypothetical protein QOK42_973, partial [Frankiaceae bacterium]|nr:hypothetical protein [Frankiaceae bacterium]
GGRPPPHVNPQSPGADALGEAMTTPNGAAMGRIVTRQQARAVAGCPEPVGVA